MRRWLWTGHRRSAGAVLAVAAAGWAGATGFVYWRTFGRFPRMARDARRLIPADFEMAYEELEVRTADGLRLLTWVLPGPRPAVVVISGGHRGHISDVLGIAAALRRSGFSVVAYGWRGTPGSDPAAHTLGVHERRDLAAVLGAVVDRFGEVPIGLLGYSMGGAVSLCVAADEPRVAAVCADSAFADPVDLLLERTARRLLLPPALVITPAVALLERRTGARLGELRPVAAVAGIAPRPLLLVHGGADASVPVEHARRLYAAAGEPRSLWILPGVGHVGAYFADRSGYIGRVSGFFSAALLA